MKKRLWGSLSRIAGFALATLASAACQTGGGGLEPIVIDLSKPKPTPSAKPSATPTATPIPSPTPPERNERTVAPVPVETRTAPAPAAIPSDRPTAPADTGAVTHPIDARIDAFNRHDLDALVAAYAPDARVYDPPDRVRLAGLDGIRPALARELASVGGPITYRDRLVQGPFVVQRETRGDWTGLVVYEIRGERIANVWVLR